MIPTLTNICLVALALILFGGATFIAGHWYGKPKRRADGRFAPKRRAF